MSGSRRRGKKRQTETALSPIFSDLVDCTDLALEGTKIGTTGEHYYLRLWLISIFTKSQ